MPGYFDPNTEAFANGFATGKITGEQEGEANGYRIGYQRGRQEGEQIGWDKAVDRANQEIEKQIAFTRQHVANNTVLNQQLEAQRSQIQQLQQKLAAKETENAVMKEDTQTLRQVIEAHQKVNLELRHEVTQLNDLSNQRQWQLNRCAVFMSSAHGVLQDLTAADNPDAAQFKRLFAQHYAGQVRAALEKGTILTPLEKDEVMASSMPRTQQFIRDALSSLETMPVAPAAAQGESGSPA